MLQGWAYSSTVSDPKFEKSEKRSGECGPGAEDAEAEAGCGRVLRNGKKTGKSMTIGADASVGCDAKRLGQRPATHTEACRNRMIEELKKSHEGEERIRKGDQRMDEELARYVEGQDSCQEK